MMKYLIIDACPNGTGIRDYYEGGYIVPENLNLSVAIISNLKEWLLEYENEFYNGYSDNDLLSKLDKRGKEIALTIKKELVNTKIEYFSDAKLTKEII